MSRLIYFMPMSLDGFVGGDDEPRNWSTPNEQVYALINELHRPIGTYLYGRGNYETMTVWETPEVLPDQTADMMEFGRVWKAADKVVYSRSLETVSTPKTRLERDFDPQAVRELKAQATRDLSVAGPNLAAQAIRAGLVDEIQLLVVPFILGRGKRVLPEDVQVSLTLVDERRLSNGWVFLRYRPQI